MALKKCPECEEYYEDILKVCPKCGKEFSATNVGYIYDKSEIQNNSQIYNDIHQIAGDLRFIKNLIIIGLVCSFILGIICVLGLV